ncbi:BZ3500_MvSof-1268-A1-R1_Chr8-1g09976 [Microbotryum saponariae]|uniref:BZ3500_MvSof-1268-A1-R1_Chr8-1g09976 protein n=1 Tax=Microbotryum saponariae TaxID=289078 RepID=A0A2X0KUM8_9BASI|nr:BZ3500_MvSof-1268-A1-R1_Chr8-1g09976 [Microbotryum saponariae]SDA08262.1 BZ3501_MvSof-1269-A2-R1_Chr8-1g09699 [Microbotryum saponariae]
MPVQEGSSTSAAGSARTRALSPASPQVPGNSSHQHASTSAASAASTSTTTQHTRDMGRLCMQDQDEEVDVKPLIVVQDGDASEPQPGFSSDPTSSKRRRSSSHSVSTSALNLLQQALLHHQQQSDMRVDNDDHLDGDDEHAHGDLAGGPGAAAARKPSSRLLAPRATSSPSRAVSVTSEVDSLASSSNDALQTPPTKKLRKGARLGRLGPILDKIPIELLADVLAYLPPVMLLRLARTAKVFRSLLMSKHHSRAIWRRAFKRDGLGPFAVEDMPEPQIAALIWDKECLMPRGPEGVEESKLIHLRFVLKFQACGRTKVHKIVYILEGRYCDPCLKQKVRTRSQIQSAHPCLHPNAFECAPFSTAPPCRGGNWPALPGQYMAGEYWLEETVLKRSEELHAHESEDQQRCDGGGRVAKRVAYWKERLPLIERDAQMLQRWQAELDSSRSSDKRSLRMERTKVIRQRCLDAGYDARDVDIAVRPESAVYAHINQPYPLTDRVWRKIERPILSHVAALRDQRLSDETRQILFDRFREEAARAQEAAAERHSQELQELRERDRSAQAAVAATLAAHAQRTTAGGSPAVGGSTSSFGTGIGQSPQRTVGNGMPPSSLTSAWNPSLAHQVSHARFDQQQQQQQQHQQPYQAHAQYLNALRYGSTHGPRSNSAPSASPLYPSMGSYQRPAAANTLMNPAVVRQPLPVPNRTRMTPSGSNAPDHSLGAWWLGSSPRSNPAHQSTSLSPRTHLSRPSSTDP